MNVNMQVYKELYEGRVRNPRDSLVFMQPSALSEHPYIKKQMETCFRTLEAWDALIRSGDDGVVTNIIYPLFHNQTDTYKIAWMMTQRDVNVADDPLMAHAIFNGYSDAIACMLDIMYNCAGDQ